MYQWKKEQVPFKKKKKRINTVVWKRFYSLLDVHWFIIMHELSLETSGQFIALLLAVWHLTAHSSMFLSIIQGHLTIGQFRHLKEFVFTALLLLQGRKDTTTPQLACYELFCLYVSSYMSISKEICYCKVYYCKAIN